jgi:tetratricopeptide (TPR) repeat protein
VALWQESEAQACKFAEQAAALDDGDAFVHIVLARVRLFQREFERAEQSIARAPALNPNDADVNAHAALWTVYLGDAPRALELARRAAQLNVHHGDWYHVPALIAQFLLGDWPAAMRAGARAGRVFVDVQAIAAAAAALAGEEAEARRALAAFREEFQAKIAFGRDAERGEELDWLMQVNPFRREADRERLRTGLMRAGLSARTSERWVEPRPPELPVTGNVFRREGSVWTVAFGGQGARLAGVKGFADLARLLGEPSRPVHCLELSNAPDAAGAASVLDAQAKRAIEQRLSELSDELEEATRLGDVAREERIRTELEQLTDELAHALGLGGRSRKLGDAVERARSATTWRIRSAIRRVAAAHPRLGQHLENSIRTGRVCSYRPEMPVAWEV